ncbi:hypothetical protein EDE04_7008 [Streptomyces sp. 2132.2]|uniref:hypothetical protein n=1 Tax=Streptomyces sp. 2132.2 TaxID=2485161 RepID=UPI000F48FDDC|nr:hypothetical protein [Streptomyces sp. 2132.2]ROR00435.1 hypothetical protein EDE04_7008 [Streptomyces sp. 2132.2]
MRTSMSPTGRIVALVLAAVASVPVLAGAASATDLYAPHARAAAKVSQAGLLLAEKNVSSAKRSTAQANNTGVFCVKVSDSDIVVRDAAIVATVNNNRAMITAIGGAHPWCANDPDTITIVLTDSAGAAVDAPFTVAVL